MTWAQLRNQEDVVHQEDLRTMLSAGRDLLTDVLGRIRAAGTRRRFDSERREELLDRRSAE